MTLNFKVWVHIFMYPFRGSNYGLYILSTNYLRLKGGRQGEDGLTKNFDS